MATGPQVLINAAAPTLCLTVDAAAPQGLAQARLQPCADGANQRWAMQAEGVAGDARVFGGAYCLDNWGARGRVGDAVGTYICVGGAPTQTWVRTIAGELRMSNGLCVAPAAVPAAGVQVALATCTGADTQRWVYGTTSPTPSAPYVPPAAVQVLVNGAAPGTCLSVDAGAPPGLARAQVQPCTGAANQVWATQDEGVLGDARVFNGAYCLDNWGARGQVGDAVGTFTCVPGARTQRWARSYTGDFRMSNGFCVAPATTPAAGVPLVLASCNNAASQQWRLASVIPSATIEAVANAAAPALCLSFKAKSAKDASRATLDPCVDSPDQRWDMTGARSSGGGIITVFSGEYCLDDWGGNAQVGDAVGTGVCRTTAATQSWKLTSTGELKLSNGLCVAPAGTPAAGVPLTLLSCDGTAAQRWAKLGTAAAAPAPTPVPGVPVVQPPAATSIALAITRFDGGNGAVVVSNGIPLAPGALRPENTRNVRVIVGGYEQPIYVEPLAGRHADGSLRAVLVRFRYSLSAAASVAATLDLTTPRATPDIADPADDRRTPTAAALPVNPDYLVATGIAGPTLTAAATAPAAAVPGGARYDAQFREFADYHWERSGDTWTENYYDRAAIYYAMWARTGDAEYWRRATRLAVSYQRDYLEPNGYGAAAHQMQIEGLERHYLLTGDERDRAAVAGMVRSMGYYYGRLDLMSVANFENRVRARALQALYAAWRLNVDNNATGWASQLDDALDRVLRSQGADGAYRFDYLCGGSLNYMDGMLNDVLTQIHDNYKADPRIVAAVRKNADYQWSTQWLPDAQSFKYVSASCAGIGNPDPSVDLNNMMVNTFAWTYARGGGAAYRTRADLVFAGSGGAFLQGSKQFNQQYTTSYRYLAYRQ